MLQLIIFLVRFYEANLLFLLFTFRSSGGGHYTVENFRPNIVVRGCSRGFAEDSWSEIEFASSGACMKVVKPCSRCKVPSVNVETGEMDPDNTITKILKTFRTGEIAGFKKAKWAKEVFVGQNVDHGAKAGGQLRVGEVLKVISYAS